MRRQLAPSLHTSPSLQIDHFKTNWSKQKVVERKNEIYPVQEQTVAHWKPISRVKYEAYTAELDSAKREMSKLQLDMIEAVSAVEKQTKAHGKTKRKVSRHLLQLQQSLASVRGKLQEKNAITINMSTLNHQLVEENQALRLSVTEFSRKVVHVCTGAHHIEFNSTIHARAADGSTPLHW